MLGVGVLLGRPRDVPFVSPALPLEWVPLGDVDLWVVDGPLLHLALGDSAKIRYVSACRYGSRSKLKGHKINLHIFQICTAGHMIRLTEQSKGKSCILFPAQHAWLVRGLSFQHRKDSTRS